MAKARHLHEILQEQQEPFYLDIHLVEKGYSTNKILEKQEEMPFCWPIHASKILHRKKTEALRRILSKILYWKLNKRTLKCEKMILENGMGTNSDRSSNSNSNCFQEESEMKKQSPVSVFEFSSYEVSPVHSKEENPPKSLSLVDSPKKSLNIFKELLQLAYITPNNTINDISNSNRDMDDWNSNSEESSSDELTTERSNISFQRESSRTRAFVREILHSDFAESTKRWDNLNCQMNREVKIEIQDAIFEEIVEELLLDIKGLHCK